MSLYNYEINRLPEYYDTMYLDNYKPYQILTALKAQMISDYIDGDEDNLEVVITTKESKK